MKRYSHFSARALCFAALFFCTSLFLLPLCVGAEANDLTEAEQKVDRTMAGLSDSQVRQMLITELKKDAESEEPDYDRMKGPAYILSRMLNGLSNEHDQNEDELRALFNGLPNVLPDLYRVFIKL